MLMSFATGCGVDNNSSNDSTVDSLQSIEYETMIPPNDGWTKQQIFDTAYIGGSKISLPATLKSMGKDFEFNKESIKVNENKHYAKAELLYKNKLLGNVRIENIDSINDMTKKLL